MAERSDYCKAYYLGQLRAYPEWQEKAENARVEKREVGGKEIEERRTLADDSIVYLHDSYVVTDDAYRDENVLFDQVTDEWKEFCRHTLGFEVPVLEPIEIAPAEPEPKPADESAG